MCRQDAAEKKGRGVAVAGISGQGYGMAGDTTNLVHQHLWAIRTAIDGLPDDKREIKMRLGILEQQ